MKISQNLVIHSNLRCEKNKNKDLVPLLDKIKWYDIDQEGNINLSLNNIAAIYIYNLTLPYMDKNPRFYLGSTVY